MTSPTPPVPGPVFDDGGEPPLAEPHAADELTEPAEPTARRRFVWRDAAVGAVVAALLVGGGWATSATLQHRAHEQALTSQQDQLGAEKEQAVAAASQEARNDGFQAGQQAEIEKAAAAEAERNKPYDEAKTSLTLAKALCASEKKDKRKVSFTERSVTFKNAGISGGASVDVLGCVLGSIGTEQSTIDKINQTRALDGRQEDQWGVWSASWGYHPDNGLDLILEIDEVPAG